jgi:hypothetical protein
MRVRGDSPNMGDHVWLITSRQTEPLLVNQISFRLSVDETIGLLLQLVDVGVVDLVHESNAGRLERILVRKLDVDLPHASGKWC